MPSQALINFAQCLEQQSTASNNKRKRIFTNQLHVKFLKDKAAPMIKRAFRKSKMNPIFHDDQDRKQRTILVRSTVAQLFSELIEPEDGDAKLADVWRIGNVWGSICHITSTRK